ncbi:MAG: rRNA maturation RNase YbeY [Bacteroidota bacterium]
MIQWIIETVYRENNQAGNINYIFCNDEYLNKLNRKYLKHSTLTDILTFDYSEKKDDGRGTGDENLNDKKNIITGDIFISIDRVKENAKKYNNKFKDELHRVMIHGILHLLGYNDKTSSEKAIMREKEDFYLSLLKKHNISE